MSTSRRRPTRPPAISSTCRAAAAQAKVLLGDTEAVVALAHGRQPALCRLAERRRVEEKTTRRRVAPADASAQLMKLGQPKALGMLDHHHGRLRHVDADL